RKPHGCSRICISAYGPKKNVVCIHKRPPYIAANGSRPGPRAPMYRYTDFDRQFVHARAAQYRDQLERWQAGQLTEEEFKPLRLQNGWYVQRYAPMLRIAVPYGEISSQQLRAMATIARDYDQPDAVLLADAQQRQLTLGEV